MLRPTNERLDVEAALDELKRSSFVESTVSSDGSVLLYVPLVAAVFGKRKLALSPMKLAVEGNSEILRYLGASQKANGQRGIGPRINSMFAGMAAKVEKNQDLLKDYLPIMEFVAQEYPPAWLLLARLFEESHLEDGLQRAKRAIERYLESSDDTGCRKRAWEKRVEYCRRTEDWLGEVQSLVELSRLPGVPFDEISEAANRLNSLQRYHQFLDFYEVKSLVATLADTMASRIAQEGDATDCSRLAWLYLRLGDELKAAQLMRRGLELEPENEYCSKLQEKLNPQTKLEL